MRLKTIVSLFLCLLPILSYASQYDMRRFIRNDTNITWYIYNMSYDARYSAVLFDHEGRGCALGSNLVNGPCILLPHHETHVLYKQADEFGALAMVNGETAPLLVTYHSIGRLGDVGLFMLSSDSRGNDSHGNYVIKKI
jgi:hypothetical protein